MPNQQTQFIWKNFRSVILRAGLFSSFLVIGYIGSSSNAFANSSLLEFRWNDSSNYKKLYYWQSAREPRARSTYYFVMKPADRKTAILKLKVTVPSYFKAKISPKKLALCKVQVGGMLAKTKCDKKVPAIFEVAKDQSYFEVFPDSPIPSDGDAYAVVMKIFNPTSAGMFQLNAMAQSPGDVPISSYIGSWSIDIH